MPSSEQQGIYIEPHANKETTMVVDTSSVLRGDGTFNFASGRVTLPGSLGRGYIPFKLGGGAGKATATASGLVSPLATGAQPSYKTMDTTNAVWVPRLRWTSAAGATNQYFLNTFRIPNDLATAGGIKVHLIGERSSAQSTAGGSGAVQVRIYANAVTTTGWTDIGTTHELTSAPVESTASVTSGNTPASGFITVALVPNPHSTGSIDLYAGGLSYQRKTS